MAGTLFDAYLPLILWTGLGLIAFRFIPQAFPRLLGRSLYWVGVPWQILALARQTDYAQNLGLAPAVTIAALILGLVIAWVSLRTYQRWLARSMPAETQRFSPREAAPASLVEAQTDKTAIASVNIMRTGESAQTELSYAQRGSFILAATIGNTGFVGLGLVPALIHPAALGWAVFYSVTHNIVGTYGVGVFLASYYGRSHQQHWWVQLRDVLSVPSLWAFAIGSLTRSVALPDAIEQGLHASLGFVIPGAFLLMGMRLSQLHGWQSIQSALLPSVLKIIILPLAVGLGTTLLGLSGDARLALVLMAGMPSAFAGLILAEEYELDRELIASSIALTTIALLFTIPLWLLLFH